MIDFLQVCLQIYRMSVGSHKQSINNKYEDIRPGRRWGQLQASDKLTFENFFHA